MIAAQETSDSSMGRVLINVPRLDLPGGVANYFRILRRHFDEGKEYFEIGATSVESNGLTRMVFRLFADYWRFHRRLREHRYSLVHLNPSLASKSLLRDSMFLLIARMHKVPVLVFFHGWEDELQTRIQNRYTSIFSRTYNKSAGIIVLAEDFRQKLIAMGISVPIFRLSTCVDDAVFDVSESLSKDDGQITDILFLSRLDHRKGAVEAIKAFSKLPDLGQARLSIAGDGPERDAASRMVQELQLDNVHFLGHIDGEKKIQAFLDADIFFFPTFFGEGMPTTVLEAMAYGLPVVTRSVGGLKDFFDSDRMGFISDSTDMLTFTNALQRLVESPDERRTIGNYNRQYARDNFATSVLAKRLSDIYDQSS